MKQLVAGVVSSLLLVSLAGCGGGGGGSSKTSTTVGASTSGTVAVGTPGTTPPPGTSAPPPGLVPTPPPNTYAVAGWQPYWTNTASDLTVNANVGNGLDEVNLFGYSLNADGTITAKTGAETLTRHAAIRAAGGELIPTLFDVDVTTALDAVLADPAAQQRTIDAVVALFGRFDYDGIDIDFEHAKSSTRAAFTRFMQDLSAAVRARGKVFSLTIPGKRADLPSWAGYDYAALGAVADRVKLMCYGYSGPWSATPGPICPTTWITRVMDYAVTTMPADKIQIGIPFYGYDWPANGGTVRSVTWRSAQPLLARAGASPLRFDAALGETTFTYTDDAGVAHTVWLQDARAIAAKCELVDRYRCRGIAIWRLGDESQTFWDEIRRVLK